MKSGVYHHHHLVESEATGEEVLVNRHLTEDSERKKPPKLLTRDEITTDHAKMRAMTVSQVCRQLYPFATFGLTYLIGKLYWPGGGGLGRLKHS